MKFLLFRVKQTKPLFTSYLKILICSILKIHRYIIQEQINAAPAPAPFGWATKLEQEGSKVVVSYVTTPPPVIQKPTTLTNTRMVSPSMMSKEIQFVLKMGY